MTNRPDAPALVVTHSSDTDEDIHVVDVVEIDEQPPATDGAHVTLMSDMWCVPAAWVGRGVPALTPEQSLAGGRVRIRVVVLIYTHTYVRVTGRHPSTPLFLAHRSHRPTRFAQGPPSAHSPRGRRAPPPRL